MNSTTANAEQQASARPASDMYRHIVDRMLPLTLFASRKMEPSYRAAYLHTCWHMHQYLQDNFPRAQHKTLFDAFVCIQNSIKAVPMRNPNQYGLMETVLGKFASDIAGRKLALTHILDLALSYQKFQGIGGDRLIKYHSWALDIVKSDLEDIQSQIGAEDKES
jgi:hypothetical protein